MIFNMMQIVLSAGIEPALPASEASVVSIQLREHVGNKWCAGKEFLPLQGQYTFSNNLKQVSDY